MKLKHTFALSSLMLAMSFQAYGDEVQQGSSVESAEEQVEKILIVGVRSDRVSKGATGLTMEVSETPQSISVVSADLIKNFAATNLNDALRLATGLNVETWETNRTNFTSRGFDIKNTQIDGIGMPNGWGIVTGAMESYGYQEIEVIRGANGLLSGVGSSAGTINYVRKRPTNENEGQVGFTLGSWDTKRVEADYSVLLTDSGSWAARVVAVVEDQASYLDGLENDRTYIYGVVDGQLTDNSTLAVGFSYQDANTDGNMWGSLVYNYTDGTQAEWDVSATTAQQWTFWDTVNTTAFIEYAYIFDNDWEIKGTYNRQTAEDPSKLFYVYGAIDKDSSLGLQGWPGRYNDDFDANLLDITALGEYSLFGQVHEATIGVSNAQSATVSTKHVPLSGFDPTPAFPYPIDAIAEPEWGPKTVYSEIDVSLTRLFASTKLNINDDLFFIAGFNAIKYTREGINNTIVIDNDESEISPYAGLTYAITDDINAYASYSDVYQPQERYDYDGYFLAPTKGINYEMGVKSQWLDDTLLATFAIFSAEQDNLAQYAGRNADNKKYYNGVSVESKGFEVEVVGQITNNLNAIFGYTFVDIEDDAERNTNKWVARHVANFSVDYTLPNTPEVIIGFGGKWQSKTKNETKGVKQDSYLLVSVFARWDVVENLAIQANINNITDEKYINSMLNVGYYGAPINGTVSLTYKF